MRIKQFDIWLADLNPQIGTEAGKVRPVVVIQTNLLNTVHPSTLVCPLTTKVKAEAEILRIHLTQGTANLSENSAIMVDQIRAIDNKRLVKRLGELPDQGKEKLKESLKIMLDLA
jgi:mRNA interferase MazF